MAWDDSDAEEEWGKACPLPMTCAKFGSLLAVKLRQGEGLRHVNRYGMHFRHAWTWVAEPFGASLGQDDAMLGRLDQVLSVGRCSDQTLKSETMCALSVVACAAASWAP